MIEAIGILLAIVGLIFAFEAPRRQFVQLFKKIPPVEHDFQVKTLFSVHNGGNELGQIGTNKTKKTYVLEWNIRNRSDRVIQLEHSLIMRQRKAGMPQISLTLSEFSQVNQLFPEHRQELLSVDLTPGEVDHFRHWVRECSAFGLKDSSGTEYWIPDSQFKTFSAILQEVAIEYGLAKEVPEGRAVVIEISPTLKSGTDGEHHDLGEPPISSY